VCPIGGIAPNVRIATCGEIEKCLTSAHRVVILLSLPWGEAPALSLVT